MDVKIGLTAIQKILSFKIVVIVFITVYLFVNYSASTLEAGKSPIGCPAGTTAITATAPDGSVFSRQGPGACCPNDFVETKTRTIGSGKNARTVQIVTCNLQSQNCPAGHTEISPEEVQEFIVAEANYSDFLSTIDSMLNKLGTLKDSSAVLKQALEPPLREILDTHNIYHTPQGKRLSNQDEAAELQESILALDDILSNSLIEESLSSALDASNSLQNMMSGLSMPNSVKEALSSNLQEQVTYITSVQNKIEMFVTLVDDASLGNNSRGATTYVKVDTFIEISNDLLRSVNDLEVIIQDTEDMLYVLKTGSEAGFCCPTDEMIDIAIPSGKGKGKGKGKNKGKGNIDTEVVVNRVLEACKPITNTSIECSPSSILKGGSVTVSWDCGNSSFTSIGTNFSTSGAPSGSVNLNPVSDTTYKIQCINPWADDNDPVLEESCTVDVTDDEDDCVDRGDCPTDPGPTASITCSPSTVAPGGSVTITWECGSSSSSVGTNFSTLNALSGSALVYPMEDTTYSLRCINENTGADETETCSINYDDSATNNPPDSPKIYGQTKGFLNSFYEFRFYAEDPDGDDIRYGIDWNMDDKIDVWIPSSDEYVPHKTIRSASKIWNSTGNKRFKAKTFDSWGLSSDWSEFQIDITNDKISCIPSPAVVCDGGSASIELSADPPLVKLGGTTTINWKLANVTYCDIKGEALGGSIMEEWGWNIINNQTQKETEKINAESVYTLSCTDTRENDISTSTKVRLVPTTQEF